MFTFQEAKEFQGFNIPGAFVFFTSFCPADSSALFTPFLPVYNRCYLSGDDSSATTHLAPLLSPPSIFSGWFLSFGFFCNLPSWVWGKGSRVGCEDLQTDTWKVRSFREKWGERSCSSRTIMFGCLSHLLHLPPSGALQNLIIEDQWLFVPLVRQTGPQLDFHSWFLLVFYRYLSQHFNYYV